MENADDLAVCDHGVVDLRISESHDAPVIQSHVPMIPRPGSWSRSSRIDVLQRHAIRDMRRQSVREKRNYLFLECRRDDLVRIENQNPIIAALILAKALLSAKAQPALRDYATPLCRSQTSGVVSAFAVDDNDFIDPRLD